MKMKLLTSLLLLSFGLAQAGPGAYIPRHHKAPKVINDQTEPVQSTAVQPGIGEGVERLDAEAEGHSGSEMGDWTDLRNEEIYGSF